MFRDLPEDLKQRLKLLLLLADAGPTNPLQSFRGSKETLDFAIRCLNLVLLSLQLSGPWDGTFRHEILKQETRITESFSLTLSPFHYENVWNDAMSDWIGGGLELFSLSDSLPKEPYYLSLISNLPAILKKSKEKPEIHFLSRRSSSR